MYDNCHPLLNFFHLFYNSFAFQKFLMQQYSQVRAMLAIARASFRSIIKNPSAVIFSILFPLIFIVVFGFIGGGGTAEGEGGGAGDIASKVGGMLGL